MTTGGLGWYGECLGWALVHFVWQGLVLALASGALLLVLRGRSPSLRYLIACIGLAAMAVAPLTTFGVLASRPATPMQPVQAVALAGPTSESMQAPAPRETVGNTDGTPALGAADDVTVASEAARERTTPVAWERVLATLNAWMPRIVLAWAAGVLLLALRLAWNLVETTRLRRIGTRPVAPGLVARVADMGRRMGISTVVRLVESALVHTPTVLGVLKPMVLLPASALTGLTPEQLDAVLAHELAHIRRHDYLVNLVQTVVETLLFYHPAVWWLSSRIRAERELCCDDLALAAGNDRATYARALALLAEHCAATPTLSVASTGGVLIHRIRRILGKEARQRMSPMRWIAGMLAATLVLGLGVLACIGNASAQADKNQPKGLPTADAEEIVLPEGGTDADLAQLAGLRRVKRADLSHCTLTGSGLVHLAGWTALTDLTLPLTVTPEAVAAATKALQGTPAGSIVATYRPVCLEVVAEESGGPVGNATVRVYSAAPDARSFETLFATDATGKVRFCASATMYYLGVTCRVAAPGYASRGVRWPLRPPPVIKAAKAKESLPEKYTLRLRRGVSIGGIIQNENGTPIPGVTVRARLWKEEDREWIDFEEETKTDAQGRWRCDKAPEALEGLEVRLSHPDYVSYTPSYSLSEFGRKPEPEVSEADMAKLREGTCVTTMVRGYAVGGTVVDMQGRPVVGASVMQGDSHYMEFPKTTTDENGVYVFEHCAPDSKVMLTVLAQGYAPVSTSVNVTGDRRRTDFDLEPGHRVTARVIGVDGAPVSGLKVAVESWGNSNMLDWTTETDVDGRFRWDAAPRDPVTYSLRERHCLLGGSCVLTPGDSEQRILLYRPMSIKGTVTDRLTGQPIKVSHGVVYMKRNERPTPLLPRATATEAPLPSLWPHYDEPDGAYELERPLHARVAEASEDREPQYAHVVVYVPGYLPARSPTFEVVGEGEVTLDFALERAAQAIGSVKGPDGKPAVGAEVFVATAER